MSYPGAYPGQQPTAPGGYPGQQPTAPGGYPGQQPTAPGGYPGQQPTAPGGYPGQQPTAPYRGVPPTGYPGAPPAQGGYPGAPPAQGGYGGAPQQPPYGGAPPHGVSPEIMNWFRAVDQDNSGFINADELSRALQSGNSRHFSVAACNTMMGLFDHQQLGRIDLTQFGQLFAFISTWTEAFRRADADRSGNITVQELTQALGQQGYNIGAATVQQMVQKFGNPPPVGGMAPQSYVPQPQQKTLGLDGFILVNVQLRRLTDAFRQRDAAQQGRITLAYEDFIAMVVGVV